jgi:hypothetical protein
MERSSPAAEALVSEGAELINGTTTVLASDTDNLRQHFAVSNLTVRQALAARGRRLRFTDGTFSHSVQQL